MTCAPILCWISDLSVDFLGKILHVHGEKRDLDLFGGVLIYCATDSDIESRRVRLGAMKLKICVSGKWIDLGHPYAFHKFILAEPPTFACLSNKFPCQNVNSMPFCGKASNHPLCTDFW